MSDPNPDQPTPHFNEVISAADLVRTVTGTEAITEPLGASKGLTRTLTFEMASVSVGWKILVGNFYRDKPSTESWGAISETTYAEEEL